MARTRLAKSREKPAGSGFDENAILEIANKNWLQKTPKKRDAKLINRIYKEVVLKGGAAMRALESSSYLKEYLWEFQDFYQNNKKHSKAAKREKLNYFMSIVFLVLEKSRAGVDVWELFSKNKNSNKTTTNSEKAFKKLLKKIFLIFFDFLERRETLTPKEEKALLSFSTLVYSNIEKPVVRKVAMKYATIATWESIDEVKFESYFAKFPAMGDLWAAHKEKGKAVKPVYKNFLPLLIRHFVRNVSSPRTEQETKIDVFEKTLELLTDLLSQLATRRFLRFVLLESQILVICKQSPFFSGENSKSLLQLLGNFEHYLNFEIDDETGEKMDEQNVETEHNINLAIFQRISFKYFKNNLRPFSLATLSEINTPGKLESYLEKLTDSQITSLAEKLKLSPMSDPFVEKTFGKNRSFLVKVITSAYAKKEESDRQKINRLALYPTERLLWDEAVSSDRSHFHENRFSRALPKLNMQFLTLRDYLVRNFVLYRLESAYQIREDVTQVLFNIRTSLENSPGGEKATVFTGFSRMAAPINKNRLTKVGKPLLGETKPSIVTMEIEVDLAPFKETRKEIVFREWEELKKHDVLFLCKINAELMEQSPDSAKKTDQVKSASQIGLESFRGCEILSVKDENYVTIGERDKDGNVVEAKGTARTFVVQLDSAQYETDVSEESESLYTSFNLLIRRKAKQNNFKAVLSTIRDMMNQKPSIPDWLTDILLGYGDPENLRAPQKTEKINFCDTFLSAEHIRECFPKQKIIFENSKISPNDGAHFRLKFEPRKIFVQVEKQNSKKNESPKRNKIRFTPKQAEAIKSSLQEGLTLIIGPPGTGKTDCATQIVSSFYCDPKRPRWAGRTLVITHSNAALNDLFEKITKTNIDEGKLLRLGYGYKELETAQNFGVAGRLEYIFKQRQVLLAEVASLFSSLGLGDASGISCENGQSLFNYHVVSRWEEFLLRTEKEQTLEVFEHFPFAKYFSRKLIDGKESLFENKNFEGNMSKARSLYAELNELEQKMKNFVPFETLRTQKDRGDYLFAHYSDIIAMTSTHAALRRSELQKLRFDFENLIMEESAQILDIETFISIAVQNPKPGHQNKLKRLVLIGDHFQLPPVVQNRALAAHSKFDQSLFTRLVRLGVPAVRLDQQGRARPELAALFSWRYDNLGNLPSAIHLRRPNAAMAHSHQFVHVAAFQGRGETTPAPHYYQNLGEAEYAVQLFMYLRLAGYPREKIVLLATYNGQRNLLRDVARRRCLGDESKKRLFGLPAKISTVDKFQGRQSDFVILSLVRTKAVGHLRDVRRLVVALSRARRGLYVFGCRALFERSAELREAFERLLSNGDKLALVRGEHYGSPGAVGSTERTGINRKVVVSGVDEMGKIVAAMTLDSMRGEKRKWETEMSKYKSDFEKSKSAKQVEAGDLKE